MGGVMRVLPAVALLALTGVAFAQGPELSLIPSQNPNALYRLFSTQNIFNLLLLNTKDGSLRKIQWDNKSLAGTTSIALAKCPGADVPDSHPGRYTLQPTQNMWTFIMLDQDTGCVFRRS